MIGIYKITNKINNKSYIGQSIQIKQRWKQHKQQIGSNKNPLYRDFQIYGLDNFCFEILEECEEEQLNEREIYWIEYYDTYNNGYNLTPGGNCSRKNIKAALDEKIFYCSDPLILSSIKNNLLILNWLLLHSHYDKLEEEYYISKQEINLTQISKELQITRQTLSSQLDQLIKRNIVLKTEVNFKKFFKIPMNFQCIIIKNELFKKIQEISILLKDSTVVFTYILLLNKMKNNDCICSKRELLLKGGNSAKHSTSYEKISKTLNMFKQQNIIDYEVKEKPKDNKGQWTGTIILKKVVE